MGKRIRRRYALRARAGRRRKILQKSVVGRNPQQKRNNVSRVLRESKLAFFGEVADPFFVLDLLGILSSNTEYLGSITVMMCVGE